jgi:hypothetical protein
MVRVTEAYQFLPVATTIHASKVQRAGDVPKEMLHCQVISCRSLHEPAQIPHDERDVRSRVHKVSEASNDTSIERGIDQRLLALPAQLTSSFH